MYGGNIDGGTCGSGCMTVLADKTDICGSFQHGSGMDLGACAARVMTGQHGDVRHKHICASTKRALAQILYVLHVRTTFPPTSGCRWFNLTRWCAV
jgi:hypothetical protein